MGVHCGEGGCFNQTPHDVTLRWMEDVLDALKTYNIGLALWNFRGGFGILDSERADVDYVDYKGHKLDKKMYDLFKKYCQKKRFRPRQGVRNLSFFALTSRSRRIRSAAS